MRIGIVTNYYVPEYGINTYFLCRELSRLGAEVTLYASNKYGKKKPLSNQQNIDQPFTVVKVPTRFSIANVPIYVGLEDLLSKNSFDLLQTEDTYQLYSYSTMKYARKMNLPLVLRHDLFQIPGYQPYRFLFQLAEKYRGVKVARSARVGIVPLKEAGDYLKKLNPDLDVRIVRFGVDISKVEEPRQRHLVLTIARLVDGKGIFDLIKALAIVKRSTPDLKLIIIGQGPRKDEFLLEVNRLGLKDLVEMIPFVRHDKLGAYYCRANLFVLPSYEEAINLCVMESISCGTPVVATNIPGIKESVIDGVNGLLVPPADPTTLADAILKGFEIDVSDPPDFSWTPVAKKMISIYEEILSLTCQKRSPP